MSLESKAPSYAGTESSPGNREQYYAELERLQMGTLWTVYRSILTREPRVPGRSISLRGTAREGTGQLPVPSVGEKEGHSE